MKSIVRNLIAAVVLTIVAQLPASGYTMLETVIDGSEIYPSTVHKVKVSVPDAYDPSRPACVYIGLDGVLCSAPEVIDSLIASGEMPVTIGIYVEPGVVVDADSTVVRYNRSNEFDATDGRFADFLESEVITAVGEMSTPDGRRLCLSDDGNDRMIFGLSSGGIAAFTAGWQRPDKFSRIFTGCGTFVPMRGGHDLQAIVRKHEPRPLRLFIQDTFHDCWNPIFGSWYDANLMLASALEFSGYDIKTDWVEGVHSLKRANEIFTDVMRYMWSGYPERITAGQTQNGLLAPLLVASEDWVADGGSSETAGEPGSALYPDGSLMAEAVSGQNYLRQWLVDKRTGERYAPQRFYSLHDYWSTLTVGGMAFDGDGNLWVVTDAGIQICDQNGRVRGILSLPRDIDAATCRISFGDSTVSLTDSAGHRYSRKMNVKLPVAGERPRSQGQG